MGRNLRHAREQLASVRMKTPTRKEARPEPEGPAEAPAERRSVLRSWIASLILVAAVTGTVAGFFLWIYPAKHYTVPIGWAQSEYLWRLETAPVGSAPPLAPAHR